MPVFQGWPKIPRLASQFVITEKIDGTNAAVLIEPESPVGEHLHPARLAEVDTHHIFAQSRTRFITPESDNFGFAAWVKENAENLVEILGPGRHFGEWWGNGIQRGYGLPRGERRFSLFNITRYNPFENFMDLRSAQSAGETLFPTLPTLGLVPVLTWCNDDANMKSQADWVQDSLSWLWAKGSCAVYKPVFYRPEGVVLFHTRSGQTFKAYCDESEKHA